MFMVGLLDSGKWARGNGASDTGHVAVFGLWQLPLKNKQNKHNK
jgi:hypothetical protein